MGLSGHVEDLGGDRWRLVVNLPAELRVGKVGEARRHYPRRSREVEASGPRAAKALLHDFMNEVEARLYIDPKTITVATLLSDWLAGEVEHEVRPKTAERYRQLVEKHLVPGLGALVAADLEPKDWLSFHKRLRAEGRLRGPGGLSEQTCAHIFHVLHRACEWAVETQRLERNPLDRVRRKSRPSPPPRRQQTWPPEKVIAAVELSKGTMLHVPIALAGLGGMRRGEICGLTWADVVWDAQLVVVRTSVEQTRAGLHDLPPKTESGYREVLLPTMVMDVLREHKRAQDEMKIAHRGRWNKLNRVVCRVDGSPMPPDAISNRWSEWAKRRRLEPYISFHGLRHSYATALYEAGVRTKTVQERLGHSTPAITRDLYVHGTSEADLEALRLQEERLAAALESRVSHENRMRPTDLSEARARKSC